MVLFVSMWPSDSLVTRPGRNLPASHTMTARVKHHKRKGGYRKYRWMYGTHKEIIYGYVFFSQHWLCFTPSLWLSGKILILPLPKNSNSSSALSGSHSLDWSPCWLENSGMHMLDSIHIVLSPIPINFSMQNLRLVHDLWKRHDCNQSVINFP